MPSIEVLKLKELNPIMKPVAGGSSGWLLRHDYVMYWYDRDGSSFTELQLFPVDCNAVSIATDSQTGGAFIATMTANNVIGTILIWIF